MKYSMFRVDKTTKFINATTGIQWLVVRQFKRKKDAQAYIVQMELRDFNASQKTRRAST